MQKEKKPDVQDELRQALSSMVEILDDRSVPRNIRSAVERAHQKLQKSEDIDSSLSTAIYELDDISNDINMPEHTRTSIWEIVSELERVKELIKK